MKKRARERQEKRENSQPISKKLRAAFLRSFRGQHSKKIICTMRVPEVIGTLGKANSHFDPTQTGSRTAPPR